MISIINTVADAWLDYFSYAVVQNTIFLGFIFLVLYLLRKASARFKCAVAIFGIIKLLVPPFLPGSFGAAAPISTTPMVIDMNVTILPAEPVAPQLSLVGMLFLLWSVVICLYLMSSLFSTARLKWRLQNSTFIKSLFVDDVFIDLYQSKDITVPMSIGIRPNRIYVPDSWSELSPDQQESLLRHEVAHIQRWDGLFHILQVIAQAIYFFHPLVWLLNSRINDYREMVCDDIAVERSHMSPLMYSRCLVHIAENMLPTWSYSSASALIKQRNKLYHRVNYQVKESTMKIMSKRKMWFIWSVLFMLFVPLSWYCKSEQAGNASQISKANLSGFIREHETDKPLEGVVLSIDGFGKMITDKNGYYAFDRIPSDNFVLKADYQGRSYDSPISFDEMPASASQLEKFGMTVNMHLNLKEPDKVPEIVVEALRNSDNRNTNNGENEYHAQRFERYQEQVKRFEQVLGWQPGNDSLVKIEHVQAGKQLNEEVALHGKPLDKIPQPIGGIKAIIKNLRYAQEPQQERLGERLFVNVKVDESGDVIETKIINPSKNNAFNEAVVAAIKTVKWSPAERDGKAVPAWVAVPVQLKLESKE